jgi:predicted NBD/HSP70 family sugar kinase
MKYTSADARLMRRLNRSAILDLVRERGPIARSQIARQLNISMPTVMRVVDELLKEDLVRWSGDSQVSGGRPRELLAFNGEAYCVIGLDLGGEQLYGTLADLNGRVLAEASLPRGPRAQDNLDQVESLIQHLLDQPRPGGQPLRGIGVGAPALTLSDQGLVTWAPSLGWRDLPLRDLLIERFGVPVVVENDVNLAALGEYGFGAARGTDSAACLSVGTGMGLGIILERKIYRGFHQSAGEIGYLPPFLSCLGERYEGFGALETLASARGIEQRAIQRRLELGLAGASGRLHTEQVFQAARQGQAWACKVVSETVDYLAFAAAAISLLIDPQVIVLGGDLALQADLLIGPILQRLEGVIPVQPRLEASWLGGQAAVLGAIMLVLDITTEHVVL